MTQHFTDPVSGRRVVGEYLIEQIMPAPGWRVRVCNFIKGEPHVDEIPAIGWAVVTRNGGRIHGEDAIDRHVTLLCADLDSGFPFVQPIDDFYDEDRGVRVIAPNMSDPGDTDLIEETRQGIKETLERLADKDDKYARQVFQHLHERLPHLTPSFEKWRANREEDLRRKLGSEAVPQ